MYTIIKSVAIFSSLLDLVTCLAGHFEHSGMSLFEGEGNFRTDVGEVDLRTIIEMEWCVHLVHCMGIWTSLVNPLGRLKIRIHGPNYGNW